MTSHNVLYIRIKVWRIDTLNSDEDIYLKIDTNPVWTIDRFNFFESKANICGRSGYGDYGLLDILLVVPHTSSQVFIDYYNTVNCDKEDHGISDIYIMAKTEASPVMRSFAKGLKIPTDFNTYAC